MHANPFAHSRRALRRFDATQPARDRRWERAETAADVDRALAIDRRALRYLQRAFWLDTRAYNRRADCALVDPQFVRRCVRSAS